jgi:hypothetical protein
MKRYNFKTKKIYESVTQYTLRFCEYTEEESEDIGLDLEKDTKPIVGKIFDTIDDAVEYALNDCEKRAINLGIDTNNVEYDVEYEDEDMGYDSGKNEECNIPAEVYLKDYQDGYFWIYYVVEGEKLIIYQDQQGQDPDNGSKHESEKESYSNKEDLNEDMNYGRDLDPEVRNSKGWKITSIVRTNQNGKLLEEIPVEERMYVTYDDAVEDAFAKAQAMCQEMGFDFDNDVDRFEGGQRVIVILPDGTSLEFTLNKAQIRSYESKNESVAERFAKLRKMFESEDDADENSDDNNDEGSEDDPGAKEAGEKEDNSDKKSDDEKSDDEKSDDEEEEDMKAVIITVKKGDEDKCKDELIDAGIAEDDIEILDADDDAENIDIRIDVNSVMELKDYLDKKGIDLEKEIGGEIVSDDEDSDSDDSDENKEDDDENKEGGDEEEFDFDNLGDIFGAEDAEE